MQNRLTGILTLKAPTYREVAEDTSATTTAAIIVIVVSLIAGILGVLLTSAVGGAATGIPAIGSPLGYVIKSVLTALIGWLVGSWVFAFVSKTFFGGKTNTGEMLRVFGFTQIFGLLGIIPIIGAIVGLVLSVIGAIIGIREASEFDTTKAILTGIVGLVALFIVSFVIGAILSAIGLA